MDPLPYIERVKIQSEILLPLFRRLRDELGRERAAALLRAAVREYAEALGQAVGARETGTSLDKLRTMMPAFMAGNALAVEPVADTPTAEGRYDPDLVAGLYEDGTVVWPAG